MPFFLPSEPNLPRVLKMANLDKPAPRPADNAQRKLRELLLELGLDGWLKRLDARGQSIRYRRHTLKRKPNGQLELRIFARLTSTPEA